MKHMYNVRKLLLTLLAGCCIGIGVGLILYANIGGDTVTVFQDGMHLILNCSYGQASRIYNFILIIIALICAKKYFGIGTIISALITGYAIDFTIAIMNILNIKSNFIYLFIFFLVGQIIYSLGLSILIQCNLGMNALDSLIYRFIESSHLKYKNIRLIVDFLLTLFGFLMGGIIGIGTILSILTTGILIEFFNKKIAFKQVHQ